jgi:putative tryptophan/tyrosine transport system substrate-binding protein
MRRRDVMRMLGAGAAFWPPATRAQPAKVPRVGILTPAESDGTSSFAAFRNGLRDVGYVEGQTIVLDFGLAKGNLDALPALARELVRLPVDVVVTDGGAATQAAAAVTRTTRRRPLIAALLGAICLLPLDAAAQSAAKVYRIAYLASGTEAAVGGNAAAFRAAMAKLGYVDGTTIAIEQRFADNHAERLPGLVDDLARPRPDVIVTAGAPATEAVKRAALAIPVVSVTADPIEAGFVESLARPGGFITGLSAVNGEGLTGKRLQLLAELLPHLTRIAYLWNPTNRASAASWKELRAGTVALSLEVRSAEVRGPADFDAALAMIAQNGSEALIVDADALNFAQQASLISFAAAHRLPSIYAWPDCAEAGGLMAYGPNLRDLFRRAAGYVDKILKGAKPGDLPVEQASTFSLVINRQTATALNLTIPASLLARADEVIE